MLYQKKNNTLEPLTGSTLYAETPIGTVIASFLAVAPSGYIKADDTVYTKAQYPDLYERIPDVFKDTVNETFTIDLREVALKGIGLSSLTNEHYSNTGLTLGEFIEDRIKRHQHTVKPSYAYSASTAWDGDKLGIGAGSTPNTNILAQGAGYDTNEVKAVGVNYFIKARHVALPIDIMDAISEEYVTKDNESYSLDEINTGKTWIDGKPIYRKVINTGALPSGTTKSVSIGVQNIDTVTVLTGTAIQRSTGNVLPLPNTTTDNNNIQIWIENLSTIFIRAIPTWAGQYQSFVTVEYTKTTG